MKRKTFVNAAAAAADSELITVTASIDGKLH